MRTTIDAAGRIVVPKALRDAMGLAAGRTIDMVFTDGRIEIELVAIEVETVDFEGSVAATRRQVRPAGA